MARRYRMTPRRRAALKKAQAASARKRRRNRVKSIARTVGTGAAFVGSTFAAYHLNRYIVNPHHAVREGAAAGKAIGKGATSLTRKVKKKPVRRTSEIKRSVKTVKKATDWSKFGYL
ncbi:hypothetical protein CL65_gp018 [Mycobacterium phage Patience]|uniref:Uncharacterized protein n=2 Tax=Patiencevirus patience TaxID=1982360 RepID=A0A0K1LT39_9CAUD|nr:hypothetical protein CL65_gp018 [Mycobacterium phage Patience]AEL97926.2 hypothetical protein PATIENCE_17 [Mycobacterium phage Patience]AKU45305.1 hypothetical protein MADRUGA_15 [Mycobacterium phage Madruga]